MMAVWVNAGALLLVMLTGVTYSYPVKPGFDPSSYSGGYGAYPASAGSTSGVMYAPAASGSGTADKVATYPASYPSGGPSYPQPSVQRQPAASSYSSNSYAAAPVASGYASGSSAPSYPQPSVQRQPAASTYSSNSYAAAAPVASGYASGSSSPSYPQPSVQRQPAASSYSSNSYAAAPVASGYASGSSSPSYPQPSVQRQPAASAYSSNSYAAAPVASGYASGSSAPSYPQPSVQRQPAASTYSSNSYAAAPEASGYASGSSAGPSTGQPTFSQDVDWAVAPPSPLSGDGASAGPSAGQFSGPSNVSPPRPPQLQGGELNKYAQIAEYGNSEYETEEQGFLPAPPPPGAQALSGEGSPSDVQPSGPDSRPAQSFYPYPYPYDYLFLTGQYPPGTITHSSSNFEQGADNYEDTHYMRYNYPASPGVQQVKISPPAFEVPQSVQQPRQPVRQSVGSASYYPSGAATGYNRPYTAAGGYRGNKRYQ
ncbi:DNA-directed RNA polymerase II subunit RPB1-like isoform X3 [Sparus aurata]|uniref:DNA-directed RNA polymerase II subunit RPB1-like isoform X3 n=1 Tax=Sparus aurata TaxID=8175 RepID=UPI0011C16D65|nr:DNA-directed RNA polymerase II subunit RPB1-like isoform X3 [Sparus aurata]